MGPCIIVFYWPTSCGALSFSCLSTYKWWSFEFQLFVDLEVVELWVSAVCRPTSDGALSFMVYWPTCCGALSFSSLLTYMLWNPFTAVYWPSCNGALSFMVYWPTSCGALSFSSLLTYKLWNPFTAVYKLKFLVTVLIDLQVLDLWVIWFMDYKW